MIINKYIKLRINENRFNEFVELKERELTRVDDTILTIERFLIIAKAYTSLFDRQNGLGRRHYLNNVLVPKFVKDVLEDYFFEVNVAEANIQFGVSTEMNVTDELINTTINDMLNEYNVSSQNRNILEYCTLSNKPERKDIGSMKWILKDLDNKYIKFGNADISEYDLKDFLFYSSLEEGGSLVITLSTANEKFKIRGNNDDF